ncbi:DNA replication regulator SLD3 [Rhizoctonia solani 123E]|uniref:DNA replication regulator SLD3 n=1 Tax=Rhizoctonia solani 123E TaxID=1423351 RepID=A0A074RZ82_9AGAM|nr:DNA replication regulator SLD3 [Rhizoctonia solani 123E]
MTSVSTVTASLAPLNVSFDEPSPVAWPSTYTLSSISDYPFGPPQDISIEAYVERRYLECLWMPEILEPLTALVPALQRVTPASDWTPNAGPHPLHSVLDEHLLSLVDIHTKYRKTIPALLEKEGDAQDAEEACIFYAWTHAQPTDESVNEEKWGKEWLYEAEKREILMQILLRMLKLTLPPPPVPKRKRRKDKVAPEPSPYEETVSSLEMLVDRIGIIRQTATSTVKNDQAKAAGKGDAIGRDWAAVFCEDVLKPLFKESLPEQYETLRYHCLPPPSRDVSPARSESSIIDFPQSQSQSIPQQLSRSLSRTTSISSRSGTLNARSLSRISTSQSRSRSGSVEPDPDVRDRSRSVSFASRSAGGIRAPVKAGVRPRGGRVKPKQLSAAPGASKLCKSIFFELQICTYDIFKREFLPQ